MGLPPIFREIVRERDGIILVTGGTGTGKTTTLAAMLNELNQSQEIHIVTLEDPIEFFHSHGKAAISQRELSKDFPSFAEGLRAALRQAPKAILVGEIRDPETLEIAMTASETGHIVFSTLHTINAGQTINRILGMFPREEEQQLRQRLSGTLRYVISQRLVHKVGGGRLLVTEIMGSNLRTRETIIYGESENKTFNEIIEAGSTLGWHTFDQSLLAAYQSGTVTEETAMLSCTNKGKMRRDTRSHSEKKRRRDRTGSVWSQAEHPGANPNHRRGRHQVLPAAPPGQALSAASLVWCERRRDQVLSTLYLPGPTKRIPTRTRHISMEGKAARKPVPAFHRQRVSDGEQKNEQNTDPKEQTEDHQDPAKTAKERSEESPELKM